MFMSTEDSTYYGNDPIWCEQVTQTHDEIPSEEIDGFCAACKYIVDDVIVRIPHLFGFLHVTHNLNCVPNDRRMVLWEFKVLCSEVMHHWVDLNRRCTYSMSNECCRRCTNPQPSQGRRQVSGSFVLTTGNTYITSARFALLVTGKWLSGDLVCRSLTASKVRNIVYTGSLYLEPLGFLRYSPPRRL